MHYKCYVTLVALAALTSGCYRYACIQGENVEDHASYATCTNQVDSFFCSWHSEEEDEYGYEEEDACDDADCDETRWFSSCSDEGFPYECDDVWYRIPCKWVQGGPAAARTP